MINLHKNEIRKDLLLARKNHDEYKFIDQNEKIVQKISNLLDVLYLKFKKKNKTNLNYHNVDNLDKNCSLGLYWPLQGEPDLLKLIISSKWSISLPKVLGDSMKMVRYQAGDPMEKSNFGNLHQPKSEEETIPKVMLMPGLAFSIKGYRIGFGKGHYDKYIAKIKKNSEIITIGVCFHEKIFEYLPYDEHDARLNYIITDQIFIKI
jgi:5-formyltetrahydrofolate cyclo-ligase